MKKRISSMSDGILSTEAQQVQGALNLEAVGMNHFEVSNHPEMTKHFNRIFNSNPNYYGDRYETFSKYGN